MTEFRPTSQAGSSAARHVGNGPLLPREVPQAAARTPEEIVAALHDLYRQSRELTPEIEPAIARHADWVREADQQIENPEEGADIHIPQDIVRPYNEACAAIVRILEAHATLVAQWDAAHMPDDLPDHGLPADSYLAFQFHAQRPESPAAHRVRLTGEFAVLQATARGLMSLWQRLDQRDDPDEVIDERIELESSFSALLQDRYNLLIEWDRAGFGLAVPGHGVDASDLHHYPAFQRLDQDRLAAIAAYVAQAHR